MASYRPPNPRQLPPSRAPLRASPGVLFWVVGPMLLIVLGMFSSSPQCVLNPKLSCAQNWHFADNGALTVWLINSLWLKCARLTLLAALSIVLSALVYHIALALRGITPVTRFVFMGAMCAIFIPPTLFLMFSKFLNRNLMSEAAPPITLADSSRYHLFLHGPNGAESFILAQEQSRALVAVHAKALATAQREPGRALGQLVVFPLRLEQQLNSDAKGSLTLSPDGSWLYGAIIPHYVIFALNLQAQHLASGPMLGSLSPFALIAEADEISEQAQQSFLKAVYEQQPDITPLWQEITNRNRNVRLLLARMLPMLDKNRTEAFALAEKLRLLDSSEEISQELNQFLSTSPKKSEDPVAKNFLDLDASQIPVQP